MLAVALPPFLVRLLPPNVYGAWSLILDISAFTGLLKFGVQTAVGRYVARAEELQQPRERDEIVSTCLAIMAGAAIAGLALVAVLAWQLGRWFPQMPANLRHEARPALLLVGGSMAAGLPFSVLGGVFAGLERYEIPAAITGLSRLATAVVIVAIAYRSPDLLAMAWGWAGVSVATFAVQLGLNRRLLPHTRLGIGFITRQAARKLAGYCASLTVWNAATLLIAGLDTTLVGAFDFRSVAYYATAASVIVLVTGVEGAIFSPLIPASSALEVRDDGANRLGRLLEAATRYNTYILLLIGLPLLLAPEPLLRLWVGRAYAAKTEPLLEILLYANLLRLSATPYAALIVGTGQQRLALVSPLAEGVTNLVASVWLGKAWGAAGVAAGTLIGAVVGLLGHFLYNMPRTRGLVFRRSRIVCNGYFRPLATLAPLLTLGVAGALGRGAWALAWYSLAAVSCVPLVWLYGLDGAERQWISKAFSRTVPAGVSASGRGCPEP